MVRITYDKKHKLIDFTMEAQEDHFALHLGDLLNIALDASKAFGPLSKKYPSEDKEGT